MIKTALVGYGLAGRVFHAPLIEECSELELIGVMSSRQEEIKAKHPKAKVYSNFEEVLGSGAELIVIATPNDTHYKFCKEVLEKGMHVVVDKPMTPTLEEGKELVELAASKGLALAVFHNRRLDGDFMTVKKLIAEKALGDAHYLESNFHRFRPQVNMANWRETTSVAGGIFFDLGPHLLDQAINLFGVPDRAIADIEVQREGAVNDDYFHIALYYGKKRVHLNASALYKAPPARFIVNGNEGSYVKYGMDPQEARLKESGYSSDIGVDIEDNYGTIYKETEERIKTEDGHYLGFYQNVAAKIKDNGTDLLVKPKEALFVMELLEALKKSSDEKRFAEKGKDYDLA